MPTPTQSRGHFNASVTKAEHDAMSLGTAFLGDKDVQQKYHHIYVTWPPQRPKSTPKGTEVRRPLPGTHPGRGKAERAGQEAVHVASGSGSVSAPRCRRLPRTRCRSFVPSHWRGRSPFFQIISFLAPEFTNWDSALPTQPLHLVSRAVGAFLLKITPPPPPLPVI